jgi:hypothetical protein
MRGPENPELAQLARKGASRALAATPAPACNTVRREGWLTLWMLGLEDLLLPSMVLKSLAILFMLSSKISFALCALRL